MKRLAPLDKVCACLSKLPGIGRRSAERMAVGLAGGGDGLLQDLIAALRELADGVVLCSRCGALTPRAEDPCRCCSDPARDGGLLCVVEDPADVLRIERAGGFRGRYHVLGGKLSPMRGQGPAQLRLDSLARRVREEPVREVILALNADVESEATASMIRDLLAGTQAALTRPAMGIPAGSGIGYSDGLTLSRAMAGRQPF